MSLSEVEQLQAQVAQLTSERDEYRSMASRFSPKDEEAMSIIHRAAEFLRADVEAGGRTAVLAARVELLEAAGSKAVSSLGGPYHERAIKLLQAALGKVPA